MSETNICKLEVLTDERNIFHKFVLIYVNK